MQKTRKLAIIGVIAASVFFVGCGKRNEPQKETTSETTTTTINTTETTTTKDPMYDLYTKENGILVPNHFKVEVEHGVFKDLNYEQYQDWLKYGRYDE